MVIPAVSLGSVWDTIVNGAKGVAQAVISFVEKVVNWVVSGVSYDLGLVSKAWHLAVNTLTTDLHKDEKLIDWLYQHAKNGVESGIGDVVSIAEDFARDAVSVVSRGLSDLTNWIHDAITSVEHLVSEARTWAVNDIYDPLKRAVDTVASDAEKLAKTSVNDLYHDVVLPIENDAKKALADGEHAVAWVEKEGAEVYNLVSKAAGWLVWFGVHTLEDVTEIPSDIEKGWRSVVQREAGTTGTDAVNDIANYIAKMLG